LDADEQNKETSNQRQIMLHSFGLANGQRSPRGPLSIATAAVGAAIVTAIAIFARWNAVNGCHIHSADC
jgi:hypothetical protein